MNPAIQVAKKMLFSPEKLKRYEDRMTLMDDHMAKDYVKNPELYAKNFEVGGKYNMLEVRQNSANCYFCEIDSLPIGVVNGKLRDSRGFSFNGQRDFVIQNGELKMGLGHSMIAEGKNVDFAGELKFNNKGELIAFSNGSGHYQPFAQDKDVLLNLLEKNGIDISKLEFIDRTKEF